MTTSQHRSPLQLAIVAIVYLSVVIGYYYWLALGVDRLQSDYIMEDGLIEYGTALALFIGAIVLIYRGVVTTGDITWLARAALVTLGLVLIFGAGEEISWGQRIFGFATPEDLSEINQQDEFNLHNIKVGDFDVNKIIFSKIFTVVILGYFLILPWLPGRWPWLGGIIDRLWLPTPTWWHSIHFTVPALAVLAIAADKKWELLEFVFAMILLAVILYPRRRIS